MFGGHRGRCERGRAGGGRRVVVRVLPLPVPVVLRLAEADRVVVGLPEGQDAETTLALSRLVLRPHELRTVAAALAAGATARRCRRP